MNSYQKIPDNMEKSDILIEETKSPFGFQFRSASNLPGLMSKSFHLYYLIEVSKNGEVITKTSTARELLLTLEQEISSIHTESQTQAVPKVVKLKSRDIRSLDPLSNKETIILIRKHAVIICLYNIITIILVVIIIFFT